MVDRNWAALGRQEVQQRRHDADHQGSADSGPKSRHGETFHQIGRKLEQKGVQYDEEESERQDNQRQSEDQENRTKNEIENSQHQHRSEPRAETISLKARDGGHGQKDRNAGDQRANNRAVNSPAGGGRLHPL